MCMLHVLGRNLCKEQWWTDSVRVVLLFVLLFVVWNGLLSRMRWFLGSVSGFQGFCTSKNVREILYEHKVLFSTPPAPEKVHGFHQILKKSAMKEKLRKNWCLNFPSRCELHILNLLRWWTIIDNFTPCFLTWKWRMDVHHFIHLFIHPPSLLTNTQSTHRVVGPGRAATVGELQIWNSALSHQARWWCAVRDPCTACWGSTDQRQHGRAGI